VANLYHKWAEKSWWSNIRIKNHVTNHLFNLKTLSNNLERFCQTKKTKKTKKIKKDKMTSKKNQKIMTWSFSITNERRVTKLDLFVARNFFVFDEASLLEVLFAFFFLNFSSAQLHERNLNVIELQWAPLNGITLGPRQTDSINRMIPLTDTHFSITSKQAMEIFKKMIQLTE
jgi:hypothetical protein